MNGNPPPSSPRTTRWLAAPSVAAILLYARALGNGFAFDDRVDILGNRFVRGPLDFIGIFTSDYLGGWGTVASGHYRPLLNLTYALVGKATRLSPAAFHALTVLAFAAVILVGVLVVRRVTRDDAIAVASGFLFALHPIATESVAAIVGLKELGGLGFGLLSLWLYARWREGEGAPDVPTSWTGGLWAGAALLAGLLYKETAAAFLPVAALVEWARRSETPAAARASSSGRLSMRSFVPLAPLAGAAALAIGLRVAVTGGLFHAVIWSVDNPLASLTGLPRLSAGVALAGRYLALYLWPACLSNDYSQGAFPLSVSIADPWLAGSLLAGGMAIAAFVLALRRRDTAVALGMAVLLTSYLLVSNVPLTIGTIFAERLFFAPSWGLALAIAGGAVQLWRRSGGLRRPLLAAGVVLLLVLAGRSWARIPDWRSDETLTASAGHCVPGSLKVLTNRAVVAEGQGRLDEARALYESAVASAPESAYVQSYAGVFFLNRGEPERGRRLLESAAHSAQPLPMALLALAQDAQKAGRSDDAYRLTGDLLQTGRSFSEEAIGRSIRGEILLRRDDLAGAAEEYRLAIQADPSDPRAHYQLGLCLETRGDRAAALAEYAKAEALAPNEPLILNSRAIAEASLGKTREALETASRLRMMAPDYIPGREQFVTLLLRAGRDEEAVNEALALLKMNPDSIGAHMVLGVLAEKSGDKATAAGHYEKLLRTPNLPPEVGNDIRRRLDGLKG